MIDDFIPDNKGVPLLPMVNADGDYQDINAFVVEVWATFIFTLVFLCVTHSSTTHTDIGAFNGACVCVGLWVGIQIALKASSAALNPAVGLALELGSKVFYDNEDSFGKVWIYLAGPWVGAILSGVFYAFLHQPHVQHLTEPDNLCDDTKKERSTELGHMRGPGH